MSLRQRPLLVDTNLIIEAHATGCWKALVGAYNIETVEQVVQETQTGKQRREREVDINEAELRAKVQVHQVSRDELHHVDTNGGAGLDDGEKHLWAHALTRTDAWILCGPDTASLKFGYEQSCKDRLVHLEAVLEEIGMKFPKNARPHFGRHWHEDTIGKLVFGHL